MSLKVISLNLRFDNEADCNRKLGWVHRRQCMIDILMSENADVIGTQEGLINQITDLSVSLNMGVHGTSRRQCPDEYCAILYKKERLVFREGGHFWISDTPQVTGSRSHRATCPRMVTWCTLEFVTNRQQICFCNTHFDHVCHDSRVLGAELIRQHIQKKTIPVVLTGDFNCFRGGKPYQILTELLTDTYASARMNSVNFSFHWFSLGSLPIGLAGIGSV